MQSEEDLGFIWTKDLETGRIGLVFRFKAALTEEQFNTLKKSEEVFNLWLKEQLEMKLYEPKA